MLYAVIFNYKYLNSETSSLGYLHLLIVIPAECNLIAFIYCVP